MTVAVDTNVVVRLLVQDDDEQHEAARRLFNNRTISKRISETVLIETSWVLQSAYGQSDRDICRGLQLLAGLPSVNVSGASKLPLLQNWLDEGMDLTDALHWILAGEVEAINTFDRSFAEAGRATGEPVHLLG